MYLFIHGLAAFDRLAFFIVFFWIVLEIFVENIIKLLVNTELEIKNLSHKFKSSQYWILKNINFSLQEGELVGLLGPSGCGKTTLLRLIAGFDTPCNGEILKSDQIISKEDYLLPPERRNIGMVFQDFALFPHLDVWKNVCFGISNGSSDKERAKWLLSLLDIYALRNRYPHQLSGGQRQRVALARALAPGTSLVLLDEPFCSLDVDVRSRLRNELSLVLKSCSASALLVTHDPHEALAICDRVAVMNDGIIQQYSNPSDIVANPSNDFVAKFVLQKNILPISFVDGYYSTPIGQINLSRNIPLSDSSKYTFDIKSIFIVLDRNGISTVLAREYRIDHYILVVGIMNLKIRVVHDLNNIINIGEKCTIKFYEHNKGVIFPEKIQTFLV